MPTEPANYNPPENYHKNKWYYSHALREFTTEYAPGLIEAHAELRPNSSKKPNPNEPLGYPFDLYLEMKYQTLRAANYPDSVTAEAIEKANSSSEAINAKPTRGDYFVRRRPVGEKELPDPYRMHLNVNGNPELIDKLDAFCTKYTESGCCYKVPIDAQKWKERHDTVVLYSAKEWTEEQKREMQELVKGHVREGASSQPVLGNEICTGVTTTNMSQSNIQSLISEAYALDANLGAEIRKYVDGYSTSSGEYYASSQVMEEFRKFIQKHPDLPVTHIDQDNRYKSCSFEARSLGKIDVMSLDGQALDASERFMNTKPEANLAEHVDDGAVTELLFASVVLLELKKSYSKKRDTEVGKLIDKYQEIRDSAFEYVVGGTRDAIGNSVEAAKFVNHHIGKFLSDYGKSQQTTKAV